MKGDDAASEMKQLWESGQIRVLILASLTIQALLTFLAPLRKSQTKSFVKVVIWMLYLLADVVAIYIIGLIQTSRGHHFAQKPELLAFWASFLLLHLGGPDTITALALEDNELWRRHALQLTTQVAITIYVFIRSLRHANPLWLPTILMFLDGFIKYFERTCALFHASRDNFRESLMRPPEAGPNYARLMEEFYSAKAAHIPTEFEGKDDIGKVRAAADDGQQSTNEGRSLQRNSSALDWPSSCDDHDIMILDAHRFYEMCKTLLADGFLSLKERQHSREFFLHKTVEEAFRIIQIELNLIYDAFYTKSFLLQKKRAIARFFCFFFVVVSLILFYFKWDNLKGRKNTDAIITYILFVGAIALDISAASMFVFSDWWVIITYTTKIKYLSPIMSTILRWPRWFRTTPLYKSKRWSQKISRYNLLYYCFKKRPFFHFNYRCIFGIKMIKDLIIGWKYIKPSDVDDQGLVKFVLKDIHKKAQQAVDTGIAKEVYNARGNLVLQDDYFLASECLSPWTVDVDYEESVLIWHLATDICYRRADHKETDDMNAAEVKFSKDLSDYMLYLVIWQQTLLSSVVGMSETRFHDTCEEARKFKNETFGENCLDCFHNMCCRNQKGNGSNKNSAENNGEQFLKNFCEEVMKVKAVVKPIVAKGDKSKSVLFDACRLAHQLNLFGEKQWEITSKVWVELLCYAAARCEPRYHIAQLSKGGELITFVWLYMAHVGLGERFLQNQGFGWTKLIIEK